MAYQRKFLPFWELCLNANKEKYGETKEFDGVLKVTLKYTSEEESDINKHQRDTVTLVGTRLMLQDI
ncbi:hypothetical protein [Staphylococcus phage SAP6]|nr:hypothetical protein [Staphylococcus phage StAP1]WAW12061.1 hypothetical protein [Staphylococcus phage StAP1]WAW12082.1 hypothetical protein [Staphylococcus phage SAP6]WAW12276.1 hypothetical protein [Staphylococcus phage SAP6]